MRIKTIVNDLIKKYDSNNPFEIASCLNIHVIEWNLHKEIKGYYKYDRRNKYIVFNSNLNESYKRFVVAHELGHAILHPRQNTPFMRKYTLLSVEKIEVEANKFAVELLLPDSTLELYKNSSLSIYEAAALYGIPRELCHLKCFEFF